MTSTIDEQLESDPRLGIRDLAIILNAAPDTSDLMTSTIDEQLESDSQLGISDLAITLNAALDMNEAEAQLSDPMASTIDAQLESNSRLGMSDLAVTLNEVPDTNEAEAQLSGPTTSTVDEQLESESRLGISDLAITLNEVPDTGEGEAQLSDPTTSTVDEPLESDSRLGISDLEITLNIPSTIGPTDASLKTQSPTPSHSHDNLPTGTVDPQASTITQESSDSNGEDQRHGNRVLIKSQIAPLYSKFQPEPLPQDDEMFSSPSPETCWVDQEASFGIAGANADSEKVEEYPILPNPVMPQLGTGGAIASFLQSKESDKAAEWSFWGSTTAPKVNLTMPVVHVAHNQAQSSGLKSHTAGQPAAEVVSQRSAIFLTDEGKVTTFPPGAAAGRPGIYIQNTNVEMKGERTQESLTGLFPQPFVDRLRELEDIQYDTEEGEIRSDGVEYKARDVNRDTPPDGAVGGQLPAALRCPECLRFHYGRCNRPSQPCILCGGQHWVKQCNCKSLRLAKIYRPGISCTRCRFMHKNQCPSENACPICLRVHEDLCLKPSGTCRYCGKEHWENSCSRWEQLDEEMGFFGEPEEASKIVDMAVRVAEFWDSDAPYFDRLKTKELDIEPRKCVTQDDFLKVVDRRDELRRIPPTYAGAKAVKFDGPGFTNAGQGRSPSTRREDGMKVCQTPHLNI